jgi:hypothetical protein
MTLHWETIAPVARDYTVFLHLVDGEGQVQAQGDGPPLDGWYPTSYWQAGEVLVDLHRLSVGQEAPTGDYRLLVGLYTLGDGLRLPVTAGTGAGTDRVPLGSLRVH